MDDRGQDQSRGEGKRERERRTTVTHTNPGWRLVAVVLAAGGVAAIGFYLAEVGHASDVATVVVIAAFFSLSYWADKRPDRLALRAGPFGKIATAVRESQADVRQWVYQRPLRVGVGLAICYGVAVVLAKSVVVLILGALYSWWLAVAVGLLVGALVVAPEAVSGLLRRLSGPLSPPPAGSADEPEPQPEPDDGQPGDRT